MKQPDWTAERAEIERVAEEYRGRGYDVIVSPSPSDLPEFVRDLQPDIMARTRGDSVLIEVKHRPTGRDSQRVRAIAQRVEAHPGWRFVLVSAPPGTDIADSERYEPIARQQASAMLAEATRLAAEAHPHASLLLAWAALEAVMRISAERNELRPPRPDAPSLMRELVSNGVLGRESYAPLNEAFQLRNAVAHGHFPKAPTDFSRAIESLRQATEDLLKDLDRPDTEAQA